MTLLTSGPNLGLLIGGTEGDEHYIDLMHQWRGFDLLIQSRVLDKDLATPPGSPADGDSYIVAAGATGAWDTHAGHLARYSTVQNTWEFFVPKAGWETFVLDESVKYRFNAGAWAIAGSSSGSVSRTGMAFEKEFAISDLVTALTTGTTKGYWRPAFAATGVSFRASLRVASTSGAPLFDVKKNGASMFSTRLSIDINELTSSTAATPAAVSVSTFAIDDLIEFNIDSGGTGAMGAIITVMGTYA